MTDPRPLQSWLACLALLALAACGPASEASGPAGEPATGSSSRVFSMPEITPPQGFPAKVKSFNGNTALFTKPPQRILPGNASLLEVMVELVDPDRFAALPSAAVSFSTLKNQSDKWADVARLDDFEAETILTAAPDLLLIHAYQLGPTVDRVIEHEVPVVIFPIATRWKDILESIQSIARIVGEDQRGEVLLAGLRERAKRLQEPSIRNDLRVLPYGNYGSGGSTAGAGTTWQIMIELAGMRNAATEAGLGGHPPIDYEQLLAIDPDFFLIASAEGGGPSSVESILCKEPLLSNLRAVREKRFLRLPEALYSTASQRLLGAAESVARQADAMNAAPETDTE